MAQVLNFDQALTNAQYAPPPAPAYAPPAADPSAAAATAASGAPMQGPAMPASVNFGGTQLPAFSLNAQPPAPPTDPTRSGLYNLLSNAGTGGDAAGRMAHANALDTLAYTPGVMDYASNFIVGDAAGKAKLDAQATNAKTFNDPNVMAYMRANPDAAIAAAKNPSAAAPALQTALDAAMQNAAMMHTYHRDDGLPPITKTMTPDQAAHVSAQAAITGQDPSAVHAVANHGDFTDDEFEQATKNLSWNQMSKLVAMQHYQTPQQQLVPAYMNQLHETEVQAKAAYDAAVSGGLPKDKQKELATAYTKAQQDRQAVTQKLIENSNAIFPNSAIQN